jgi:hypothetical protein
MSLRADIHDALDAELPRSPVLGSKVAALIRADLKDRQPLIHRARRTQTLRAPLYLVAAALIVVLIAGLILGGRYLRDINGQTPIDPAHLRALESRPIRLPTLEPGAICPDTPPSQHNARYSIGSGPVSMVLNERSSQLSASGNYWWEARLEYHGSDPGVVLIRAVDINAVDQPNGYPVWFASITSLPSAVQPVGPVEETDVFGKSHIDWHTEAAFSSPVIGSKPLELLYLLGVAYNGNCVGWQFDGPGFSENIVTSS